MNKFQLARLRRVALMGEYLKYCAPADQRHVAAALAVQYLTGDQMVAAILDARGDLVSAPTARLAP